MAETSTIARPYAQAVLKLAKAGDAFAHWSEMLTAASAVASIPAMTRLTGAPLVDRAELADLFIELCGEQLDEQGRNLIRLLADNRRLALLPDIAAQYERLREEAEGIVRASLITAQPIADEMRDRLAAAIGRRLDRKVTLGTESDEALIAGAILRAGDWVIDGSARGQLQRMASTLGR